MHQAEGQGGQLPSQILADQKVPPGSGGTPHYYLPPRIFDPWCIPVYDYLYCNIMSDGPSSYNFINDKLSNKV